LNGVRFPGSMSAELVEGVRDRQGGMFAAQLRLSNDFEVGATGFYSKMKAENYGRLYSGAMFSMLQGLNSAGAPNGATASTREYAELRNPVVAEQITVNGDRLRYVQSAEVVYRTGSKPLYIGNMGTNLRSGAEASSSFFDVDGTWNVNKDLNIKALFSTTRGVGATALDQGLVYARNGLGTKFQLNGLQEAPTWSYSGAGGNKPGLNADGSGYNVVSRAGARNQTVDSENSLALDAEWDQNSGFLQTLQFGARLADHKRDLRRQVAALKTAAVEGPDPSKTVPFPSNFGGGLGGGIDPGGFYFTRDVVEAYLADQIRPTSEEFERRVVTEIELKERQTALYAMQSFDASEWTTGLGKITGNVGLRVVRTEVKAQIATPLNSSVCPKIEPGQPVVPCARFPDAINTASDGTNYYVGVPFAPNSGITYYKVPSNRSFDHLLPSLNLRWAINSELIARLGASKTIGRQNYNIYGAGFTGQSCETGGVNCTVIGPNPTLEPQTALNSDFSLAWFYARRSLLQISLFDSLISGYAKTGATAQPVTIDLTDPNDLNNTVRTYTIRTASQQRARIQGVELGWEQPIAFGFGFNANLSFAKTRVADGRPMAGASKQSRNLGLYFENDVVSVRAVYNYRSEYVASTTAPAPNADSQGNVVIAGITMPTAYTYAAPVANVALSANWNITPELQISFNGTNLTNPRRAQYLYSEAEVQKLDVSGRQYFLEARYKF
jgi:iron complex outermembrane recepter protein